MSGNDQCKKYLVQGLVFMQDKIVVSHTFFGGHVDVNSYIQASWDVFCDQK